MADKETEDKAAPAPAKEEPQVARVGVKDAGKIVKTAGGELFDGRIADIADGDD